jgi:uncharacterized protein YqeY
LDLRENRDGDAAGQQSAKTYYACIFNALYLLPDSRRFHLSQKGPIFQKESKSMSLRLKLNDAMKEAMKAKDAKRLATLRLVLAALKDRDIAARTETSRDLLGDDEILTLLAKMIKQRDESATAFDAGNRPELAAGEREEIAIIRSFMPAQMDEAGVQQAARTVIAELGASSIKDMGKVMAAMKERYAGQMDFARASAVVKETLSAPK